MPQLKRLLVVLVTISCALAAVPLALAQAVRINEVMYHPPGTNLLQQWIEIHNPGVNPVSVSGWKFTKGVNFTLPPNTILPADGYLVIAADAQTFANSHPTVLNFLGGWTGHLSYGGAEIRLEDASSNTVDTVTYAHEGDWGQRRIGPLDSLKRQGWEWFAEHDGDGSSLELVNPALAQRSGQNWASSSVAGGTPGQRNSQFQTDAAPLILDAAHSPVVPRSTDRVSITARLVDERPDGLELDLHWRVDGAATFTVTPMLDDGANGDGLAGDGIFGASLPPHADQTVIEYYLVARDQVGNSRTYPNVLESGGARSAFLLLQVDNTTYQGSQPMFRLIMTRAEYAYLTDQVWGGEPYSDAAVNGAFVGTDGILDHGSTTQFRYQVTLRNRGHGTRTSVPHNFHVGFPADAPWKGRSGINLNTHYTHSQMLGSSLFRRLEMPMADSRPVQVRVNGASLAKAGQEQFGSYAANEPVDGAMVKTQFPLDPDGNLYRGIRDMIPGISASADLVWHGPSYTSYTNAYAKENNATVNDWSDLLHLIDVLNNTPASDYAAAVEKVAHVDEWMKYFAVNTLLDNQENSLGIGSGDDYSLYRGVLDQRFLLLPYDMDSLMGRGVEKTTPADGLWRMTNVAAINRFMKQPEFVPAYFKHLQELAEKTFAPARMNPLLDHLLAGFVDPNAIANMKAFNASHVAYVLGQIPLSLTVAHDLPVSSGLPRAASGTITLHGAANAIDTRSVLVSGQAAAWTAWQGAWTNKAVALEPGLNHILIQALDGAGLELARTNLDVWFDDGSVQSVSGTIAANTTWSPGAGPFNITGNLTVASGATLTIQPGTSVYLASGADLRVASGGRLLAEGTAALPITFAPAPGSSASWGGIVINGGAGSPECRLVHAHIVGNGSTAIHSAGGTVFLDHLAFGTPDHQYVSLDDSSFVVSHCVFPSGSSAFELAHGTGGIKPGGHGLFLRNFFGATKGYSDVIDFTGCNRPGAIVHFLDNVFTGSSDDILDLDGTDAWVEGNIFLHCHKNGTPDSSSAVSGGNDSGNTSQVTVINNLFFDCDQIATAKQGNFYTFLHNTMVHQTKVGGLDTDAAVLNLADDGTTEGLGMYLEGNIIYDAEKLLRNVTNARLTFTNNLMPFPWSGPGGANSTAAPLLKRVPSVSETMFTTWDEAQVLRDWLSLAAGSPAIGAGPNHQDLGALHHFGVTLSGEPAPVTSDTTAILSVGLLRTGSPIPTEGWPQGSGFTHYRWRLDGGAWSAETPIAIPIALTGLANGPHRVEVSGRLDSGLYQDDPLFGEDALPTLSRSWTVDPAHVPDPRPSLRINEVLAKSTIAPDGLPAPVDLIELWNFGAAAVDLSGLGLTDNKDVPYKYTFPAGASLAPGAYLVLVADSATGGAYAHTGFNLSASGDDLSLFDRPAAGGGLIDSVEFGVQMADHSIGRRADGTWGLCQPTFGSANLALPTGDIGSLRVNEWLTDARFLAPHDFIELYNPGSEPVALGGLFLSDAAGAPTRHEIAPLSFIPAKGFAEFVADAQPDQGANHLNFKLSPDVGVILLSAPDGTQIDEVNYLSQKTDVSEGRSPNGADTITTFAQPTPGSANAGSASGDCTVTNVTISLLPMTASWKYNQTANLNGLDWHSPGYNDASWPSGPALLAVEDCNCLPAPGIKTPLTIGRSTYYFRTHFVVETNLDGFTLHLNTVVDDGLVLYLNGAAILTNGMPAGSPTYATFASRNVGNAVEESFTLPAGLLVQGTNVLAAEVHQVNATSTDIVWGLSLDASRAITNCSPTGPVSIVLNEVKAATPIAAGFVELFNPGATAADLADMSLSDDPGAPRQWVFPAGSVIPPGGYRVLHFDAARPTNAVAWINLKSSGATVLLFNAPAAGGAVLDSITYGLQTPAFSIARVPNAAGAWSLSQPTSESANLVAQLGDPSALRVNEWMADPTNGPDWFELFNPGPLPVALGGLFLTDNLDDKTQSPIPPLSFIGAGGDAFVQMIADGHPDSGADHVNFSLKKAGEEIGLYAPTGLLVDGVRFATQTTGVSQGRLPDGATTIVSFDKTPSPAASNHQPSGDDSDGDGLPDAWEQASFGNLDHSASEDSDGDGLTNLQEFLAGTNPANAEDYLRISSIVDGPVTTLRFTAVASKSYSVLYRDDVTAGVWQVLKSVNAGAVTGPVQVDDTTPGRTTRFYRVVTPAQ